MSRKDIFIPRKLNYYGKLLDLFENRKPDNTKAQEELLSDSLDEKNLRILTGEPGYGKTVLLDFLKGNNQVIHLPFMEGKSFTPEMIGNNLMILDALDEVSSIGKITNDITDMFLNHEKLTIIISCRKSYMKGLQNWLANFEGTKINIEYFDLLPLNENEIKAILKEYLQDESSLHTVISKFHLSQSDWHYMPSRILQAPRYVHYIGKLLQNGKIQPDELPPLYDLLNLIIDHRLEEEFNKPNYKEWEQLQPMIRNLQAKLALVMKAGNKNSATKSELADFFDQIDSNFATSFVSKESLKFFIERSLLKEIDNGLKVEFDNKDLFDFLAAWELDKLDRADQTLIEICTNHEMKILLPQWYETISLLVERNPTILPDLLNYLLSANNDVQLNDFINKALQRLDFLNFSEDDRNKVFNLLVDFRLKSAPSRYTRDSVIAGVMSKLLTYETKQQVTDWFENSDEFKYTLAVEILHEANIHKLVSVEEWFEGYYDKCLTKLKLNFGDEDKKSSNDDLLDICFGMRWTESTYNFDNGGKIDIFINELIFDGVSLSNSFGLSMLKHRQRIWNNISHIRAVFHFRTLISEHTNREIPESRIVDNISNYNPLSQERNNYLVLPFIQLMVLDTDFCNQCTNTKDNQLRLIFHAISNTQNLDQTFHEDLTEAIRVWGSLYLQFDQHSFLELLGAIDKLPSLYYTELLQNWLLDESLESGIRSLVLSFLVSRLTVNDSDVILSTIDKLLDEEWRFAFMYRLIQRLKSFRDVFNNLQPNFVAYFNNKEEERIQNERVLLKFQERKTDHLRKEREYLPHLGEAINTWIDNPSRDNTHRVIYWAYQTKNIEWENNQIAGVNRAIQHLFTELDKGTIPCNQCIISAIDISIKKGYSLSEYRGTIALYIPFVCIPNELLKNISISLSEMYSAYQRLIDSKHPYLESDTRLSELVSYLNIIPSRSALPILESALWNIDLSSFTRKQALEAIDKITGIKKDRYLKLSNDSSFIKDSHNKSHLDYELAKLGERKEIIQEIINQAVNFPPPLRQANHGISVYGPSEMESKIDHFLSRIVHSNYRNEFTMLLEESLNLCGSDSKPQREWGSNLLNHAERYFFSNLQKGDTVLWEMLGKVGKRLSENFNVKTDRLLSPWEIYRNLYARLARTYAEALSIKPILNSVHYYNDLSKKRYLPVRNVDDLQQLLIRIIENDLQKWISEEGAYSLLNKISQNREVIVQKSIKSHFELCMVRRGLRSDELNLHREPQGLNDKKPDYVVNYGIIGSVMTEIKMADNDECRVYKRDKTKGNLISKAKEYVSTLQKYLSITHSSVGIFLIVDQGEIGKDSTIKPIMNEEELNVLCNYYAEKLPQIRVCYLQCFE